MVMHVSLDAIDFKILKALIEDGRIPFSTISKDVNISDVAVKRRIDRLVKRGVLKGFSAKIDLESMGFTHPVFVGIRTEIAKSNNVIKELGRMDEVSEVYQMIGETDILVKVMTNDLDKTKQFIDNLSRIDGVLDIKTHLVLKTLKEEKHAPVLSVNQSTFE